MTRILKLGRWLPMPRLGTDALNETNAILERWDVPHEIDGVPVAEDIDDREPRFWRTRDGHRVAGRLTVNDLALGAPSPATPLVIGLIPLLAMVTTILFLLTGWPGAAIGFAAMAFFVYHLFVSEGLATAATVAIVGGVMPFIGVTASSFLSIDSLMSSTSPLVAAGVSAGALACVFIATVIVTGSLDKARLAFMYVGGFLAVSLLAHLLLPAWARPAVWFLVGAGLPAAYSHLDWTHYIDRLVAQDTDAPAESTQNSGEAHIGARLEQARAVMRDTSPVFKMGVAHGAFTQRMDGYAPDKGKWLCMSADDSTMHIAIFGSTGTRKTSFIRGFIDQWVRAKSGGMLVLDEKDLPGELRGLRGYTLIEPGVIFAPLEGLNPTETTTAIFGAGHGDTKSSSSASQFFETSAKTMWLNGAVLVQALKDMEIAELTKQGRAASDRRLLWTISCIRDVISRGVRMDKSMTAMLDGLSENNYRRSTVGEQHMLDSSIDYWKTTIPTMDAETRSNVFATLLAWIDPMISHPDLVAFAYTEKSEGFDLRDILTGGLFGVNLPEHLYGMGGLVISSLTKQRGYKLMRERGSRDWRAAGEKRVLFVVDEAANLVSDTDVSFLKVARGFGACCMYSVQNADAYVKKLGSQSAAETFLDNFRSIVCMSSTSYTYDTLSHKVGTTRKPKWAGSIKAVNYQRSLKMLAESALLDPNHPGAARMRTLLRRGAGMFKEGKGEGGRLMRFNADRSSVDALVGMNPIEQVKWEEAPLLEKHEWDSFLAEPGVAVAQVMRGGVRRRDIIYFRSLREFPPELLAAEPAPAPSAPPPSDESTAIALDLSDVNRKRTGRPITELDAEASVAVEPSTPTSTPTKAVRP